MSATCDGGITQLLGYWRNRQPQALNQLVVEVYGELLRLGHRQMRHERRGHTLQTIALVHEAYLRLLKLSQVDWRDRHHFFAVAAGIMRRVLIDQARSSGALKRGGDALRVTLDENLPMAQGAVVDTLALDAALKNLADYDAILAQVVELRYFGGLTVEETAEVMGIAPATVKRKWTLAQAWLYRELHDA